MRIAIVLPNLEIGGAERTSVTLAHEFSNLGHEVEFVLMESKGDLLAELAPEHAVHDLGTRRLRNVLRPMKAYFRDNRCDVAFVNMWPLTVIVPLVRRLARSPTKIVVIERCPLSHHYAGWGILHRGLLKASIRLVFPLADARIAISNGVADDLARLSGLSRSRIEVVNNPVKLERSSRIQDGVAEALWLPGALKRILTVGRLKPDKNHELLIRAVAILRQSCPVQLMIVGDGALRDHLIAVAEKEGLADRLLLPGFRDDPFPFYRTADLFVLSSDYEGFGNVLPEAMGCGIPVVSTDCPGGPAEILEEGRYGRLVPPGDAHALADAMREALADLAPDRAGLKNRANAFTPRRIAECYLSLVS